MEKIEIGEYVRTKNGKIDKVERFSAGLYMWCCENGMYIDECNHIGIHLEDIVKHSKQLIDLIKKDDYVNGYKVIKLKDGFVDGTMAIVLSNNTIIYRHHSEDIKTILTKERYMANCYKVGGGQKWQ